MINTTDFEKSERSVKLSATVTSLPPHQSQLLTSIPIISLQTRTPFESSVRSTLRKLFRSPNKPAPPVHGLVPSPQILPMEEMTCVSEHLLRTAVEHSLRAFLEPNAIFLAERLHALHPSDASANLLATAHLRSANFSRALDVLRPAKTPANRYLYAVASARIGTDDALRDAEAHLRGVHGAIDVVHAPSPVPANTPGGAAGLYLLATICQRTGRRDEAVELYHRAVKANPTLWTAFEALASMGIVPEAERVLGNISDSAALDRLETQPSFQSVPDPTPRRRHKSAPIRDSRQSQGAPVRYFSANGSVPTVEASSQIPRTPVDQYATPSPMLQRQSNRSFGETTPSIPQAPRGRNVTRRMHRRSVSPATDSFRPTSIRSLRSGGASSVRNPSDLFATPPSGNQKVQREKTRMQSNTTYVEKQPQATPAPSSNAHLKQKVPQRNNIENLDVQMEETEMQAMDLIRVIGQIVSELGRYRCTKALELSNSLPWEHRNSGMVLSLRGRAYLEKGEYAAAEEEFLKSLQLEPSRMDGIVEYYSTVLWHLKKEKELTQLAIRAQRVHPVSSSAWCATGNCFSLQRDPDLALKYFRRAIATSKVPNPYPYALSGHEHVAKEDFDAALASYRQALHIDERHYNAMYGIGQVLQKQEKFAQAQSHFRSALLVHPLNSTLHYHLGVALAAAVNAGTNGDSYYRASPRDLLPALAELETAANLDPRNPVPRFERAKVLVAMNRLKDARLQLEQLRDLLPKEAEVHFELSRVCLKMGDKKSALRGFSMALDIEPKERKYKKALEALSNEIEADMGM